MILQTIETPADLRLLDYDQLNQLAEEIRSFLVETVTTTGGHLGSNLGAVELTLALHRVFNSPTDAILWDTGHQAYVHKLVTGRRYRFGDLRRRGGLSGYPNRSESDHDWIENSHASTALSYAHGLSTAFEMAEARRAASQGSEPATPRRRVVAVVGDGALTGGMAYEALNNLGHSRSRVVIVLNDNGRSYAPTVSLLTQSLTSLRLNPRYVQARERIRQALRDVPGVGGLAYSSVRGLVGALREIVAPHTFFEALGIRYAGPIDGHDIAQMEHAFRNAAEWDGPIVVHCITHKGRGYAPAEQDYVQHLHDVKVRLPSNDHATGDDAEAAHAATGVESQQLTYTEAFTRALLRQAELRKEVVALTAAMPGPTGLLPMESRFPDRCIDVGIAEQHAVTAAAGMAMGGLRPIVAVYSTFFTRAFDQANLDVGLHGLPVVFVLDRAGITGDDGPSHHGLLDFTLTLSIPGMTVFAPSSPQEVDVMLEQALALPGPSVIRFPKVAQRPARQVPPEAVGHGLHARLLRRGDGRVCLLGVGKLVGACEAAADELARSGIDVTLWDVRVVSPPDPEMLDDASRHEVVITAEDAFRFGGAGMFLVDAMRQLADDGRPMPKTISTLGVPRRYIPQGRLDDLLSELGLDGPGIAAATRSALGVHRGQTGAEPPGASFEEARAPFSP